MTSEIEPGRDLNAETERIMQVLKKHKSDLLAKPNVVGVAIGFQHQAGLSTQNLALVVMVEKKIPSNLLAPEAQIPVSLDGVPVDVQVIGQIKAQ
ncbi:MAG: hypothetical protein ACWGOY_01735 [Anaerolineales bacterium]